MLLLVYIGFNERSRDDSPLTVQNKLFGDVLKLFKEARHEPGLPRRKKPTFLAKKVARSYERYSVHLQLSLFTNTLGPANFQKQPEVNEDTQEGDQEDPLLDPDYWSSFSLEKADTERVNSILEEARKLNV